MKRILIILSLILTVCIRTHAQDYTPTYFSRADFKEDVQYITQNVTHVHPKLLDTVFYKQWKANLDSITHSLHDSITFNEGFIKVSQLLSFLHDGHTDFSFSYSERTKYMQNGGVTMPFTVRMVKDKLFINQYFGYNWSTRYSGAEILSINSIDSKEILKKMRSLSGAVDNWGVERYFGPYFWMFFGEFTEYKLFVAKEDSIFSITAKGVSTKSFFELKNKYYPEEKPVNYELTIIDPNSTAVLRIKRFADDLAPFLRQAFDSIKYRNSECLIIDVRDNPGGNSRSVDSLLNYLTQKSYTQYSSISLRVSDDIKKHYQKNKPDIYQTIEKLPIDELYKFDDNQLIHIPIPKSNSFSGKIFVLANNHTFSAAATFTGVIKNYQIGRIIGQPTGELIRYFGDYLTFRLPHMGIDFVVSTKEFVQHGGNVLNQGVIPDVLIKNENWTIAELAKKYCNSHPN